MELFPSIRIQQNEYITSFDRRYIINIIQNSLEQRNVIDLSYYLTYALIYGFAISLPIHTYLKMVNYL